MRFKLSALLVSILLAASCSSPSDTTVTIGAAMTGTVKLYNTDANTYYPDASGASVKILGTAYTTTTDANGKWTFNSVPPGIYTIEFTKTGFDSLLLRNHKFSGAGVDFVDTVILHSVSALSITFDSIQFFPRTGSEMDTNLFLYFRFNTLATPSFIIETSTSADTTGWKSIWAPITLRDPHAAVAKFTSEFVRSWLSREQLTTTAYFRIIGQQVHGSSDTSGILSVRISRDSLILESMAVGGDNRLEIHGRYIGRHPYEIQFQGSQFNDTDSLHWKSLYTLLAWNADAFTASEHIPDVKSFVFGDTTVAGDLYVRASQQYGTSTVLHTYLP